MDITEQNAHRHHTTHVTVAPQITSVSAQPGISLPTRPVRSQGSVSGGRKPGINWGGVAKGALITAAVVAAVVVGAIVATQIFSAVAATSIGASMIGGAASALDIAAGIGTVSWNVGTAAVAGLGQGLGISSAAAAPTAIVMAKVGALSAWIGGIGAGMLALPLAMKQFAMIQFMDPGMAAGMHDTAAQATMAKKTTLIQQHPQQNIHANTALLPDPSDSLLDESALQTSSKAIKVVHHAAEDNQEHQQHRRTAQNMLARSTNANRNWTERAAASQPAKNIPASRTAASFAENLQTDLAREQALNDGSRT